MSDEKREIRVFVSSAMSESELEYEREIATDVIKSLNLAPILFELLPSMSRSPAQAYLEEVKECDIFILILWKTLRPPVLEEFEEAIAQSKPILIFLKDISQTEKRDKKLNEFIDRLHGGDPAKSALVSKYATYRSLKDFRATMHESVSEEIANLYKEPTSTMSREEMYELGSKLVNGARRRLLMIQRTPSLFLYSDNVTPDTQHELTFQRILTDWIDRAKTDDHKELVYAFCPTTTKKVLKSVGDSSRLNEIRQQIALFKQIEIDSNQRLRFVPIATPFSGPICISDNRFAIWILGDQDAVSVAHHNRKMADVLARIIRTHVVHPSGTEQILKQLGLA